jgi:hypothetical protein
MPCPDFCLQCPPKYTHDPNDPNIPMPSTILKRKISHAASSSLGIEVETIGPQLAASYLELNRARNRKLIRRNLEWLKREMESGRYQPLNGDTIRFNEHGELIDGQHRLNAIIATGKTYQFIVVRGVADEAFQTIDEGVTRTTKDYLSAIPNTHYHVETASAIRWAMLWVNAGSFRRKPFFTTTERLAFLDAHPQLQPLVYHYGIRRSSLRMSIAMQAACHYIIEQCNPKLVGDYMTSVIEGLELRRGDPRYTVREWIIKNRKAGSMHFTADAGHVILRGWNHWRRHETWANVKQPDLPPEGIEY